MYPKLKDQIQEQEQETLCPKDFTNSNCVLNNLCKGKNFFHFNDFIECVESDPAHCEFAISAVNKYLCKCPIPSLIKKSPSK